MQGIILTGCTGGLGSALAKAVMDKDCGSLICLYRNEEKFRRLFPKQRHNVYPYQVLPEDDYASLTAILNNLPADEFILILNAFSIAPLKLIGEYTCQDIHQMIDANIKQNVILINEVISLCHRNSLSLRIINLDSGAADFPLRSWGNYCAAKAYMNSFLSVIALENPDFKVVSYDPGVMDTDMQQQIRETPANVFDQVEQFISYKEDNRLTAPSVIAEDLINRYIMHWTAEAMREKHRT